MIITEKPSSARKVAEALADSKAVFKKNKQSGYFELTHRKKPIMVTSAVGHLYGLVEDKKNGWSYPVFDIKWEPTYKFLKKAQYVKDYLDTIAELAKQADEFTVACDFDTEGEVIGWNCIRFTCRKKDANRMKFSTLTKPDLVEAYEQKRPHLEWGQAYAGETRHKLDWFYGINLSRALTASVKTAGAFKIMSIGRVQGPALKMLVEREKEITAFQSEPYWQIVLHGDYKKSAIEAWHVLDKIFEQKEVERILKVVKGEKEALIAVVKRTQREQSPPYPFDLTTLQTEAYGQFKLTPKETLDLAQSLYLAGVTSYPRTSSQQLDPKLGFRRILSELGQQESYQELCQRLLKQEQLRPNNGKKTDPAHPAIFPTGLTPKSLKPKEQKIYDLIVKRFLATFATSAIRETMEVTLNVKGELFIAKGTRTLQENWYAFYRPYVKVEEVTLPDLKEGGKVSIKDIKKMDKETQPPPRYNQSSIIKELEKRNLGTKATRAEILERLFQRGYVEGVQIIVTKLGMETEQILEKHAPLIVDEQLTAHFEEDMDNIRAGKEQEEKVLEEAKKYLIPLLTDFKKKEKAIGVEILKSLQETREEQNFIGVCPACTEGKLMVRMGKFGRFVACGRYPKCSTTFKLPGSGLIKSTDKTCEQCHHPLILIIQRRKAQEVCLNHQCPSKTTAAEKKEIKQFEQQDVEKKCPKCGKELVVRKSVYGTFIGCSGYPQCRHTEKLEASEKKKAGEEPGKLKLEVSEKKTGEKTVKMAVSEKEEGK